MIRNLIFGYWSFDFYWESERWDFLDSVVSTNVGLTILTWLDILPCGDCLQILKSNLLIVSIWLDWKFLQVENTYAFAEWVLPVCSTKWYFILLFHWWKWWYSTWTSVAKKCFIVSLILGKILFPFQMKTNKIESGKEKGIRSSDRTILFNATAELEEFFQFWRAPSIYIFIRISFFTGLFLPSL